jgi:hypothetical protein
MLRLFCALGFAFLAGSIVWAFTQAPFWESASAIAANPWGVVTLIDLYLGFFIFAIVIARFEPNRGLAVALIAAMPVLGNVVPLAWLVWRGLALIKPATGGLR